MKKILAVATALVLAISSLCVFVVADSEPTVYTYEFGYINSWTSVASIDSTLYGALTADDATITVEFTLEAYDETNPQIYFQIMSQQTSGSWNYNSNNMMTSWTDSSSYNVGDTVSITVDIPTSWQSDDCVVENGSQLIFNPSGFTATDLVFTVTVPDVGGSGSTDYVYEYTLGRTEVVEIDSTLLKALKTEGTTIDVSCSVAAYADSNRQCYYAITLQSGNTYENVLSSWSSASSYPVGSTKEVTFDDLSALTASSLLAEGTEIYFSPSGFSAGTLTVTITVPASTSTATTYDVTVDDTIENGDVTPDVTSAAEGDTVTLTVTPDSGYELDTLTVTDANGDEVTVASDNTFTMPASNVTVTATFVESTASTSGAVATLTFGTYDVSSGGWVNIAASYEDLEVTASEFTAFVEYLNQEGSTLVLTVDASAGWAQAGFNASTQIYCSSWETSSAYTVETVNGYYVFTMDGKTVYDTISSSSWYTLFTSGGVLVSAEIYLPEEEKTTNSVDGVIYVNEDYHGILITRNGRRHLLCIPHTVNDAGYCTVCHEYIGSDSEVETVSINGGEYVEAYYAEVGINSENDSRWGSKDLGGTELIEALAQDGAILVITRDGVSDTVFSDDGDFEKFGLVNAWWTGDGWVALGTAGHTSADEEGVVDCLSDDGTTVIYDGATVYAAWQALNLNTGSNTTIISNTSNSLSIVSVAVYVPADAVSVEEVEVSDPQESGETDSEDDGEDLTVDDSEPETPAETNPTTGAVLALVPMAIAGLAVVASKRR